MNRDLIRVVVSLSGKRQKALARRLGISPSYFSRMLRGSRSPSKKIILKLAKLLKYPDPSELLNPNAKVMVGHAR